MQEKNLYIILEVKESATPEEIRNAFRLLAKKYHPDKNIGNKAAEEVFKEIQHAYAILSNPEKKRKYDQRFFRKTSPQQPHYNPNSSMPFSGNAYQYAQQQAQMKQRQQHQAKQEPVKQDRTESWQILVSVGIAMVLLYFIISYSTDTPPETTSNNVASVEAEIKSAEPAQTISDFESPYSSYFGEEISDMESKNSISIFNSDYSEAVVCLVETKEPHRVIRNQYIPLGRLFKMNAVPDGEYSLRIYYGSEWNTSKSFLNNSVKGGFKKELGFAELNTGKDALKMKREKAGTSDSYSSYEVIISPADATKNGISAAEFFRK